MWHPGMKMIKYPCWLGKLAHCSSLSSFREFKKRAHERLALSRVRQISTLPISCAVPDAWSILLMLDHASTNLMIQICQVFVTYSDIGNTRVQEFHWDDERTTCLIPISITSTAIRSFHKSYYALLQIPSLPLTTPSSSVFEKEKSMYISTSMGFEAGIMPRILSGMRVLDITSIDEQLSSESYLRSS